MKRDLSSKHRAAKALTKAKKSKKKLYASNLQITPVILDENTRTAQRSIWVNAAKDYIDQARLLNMPRANEILMGLMSL